MIVKNRNHWLISKNSIANYWGRDVSPDRTAIGTFISRSGYTSSRLVYDVALTREKYARDREGL
jgi:hypothetical protein